MAAVRFYVFPHGTDGQTNRQRAQYSL